MTERLTYKWKKRPYAHQVLAVKKLLSTGFGGALLMEPRTGKTKVCIDYVSILHLKNKVSRVIVFCPLGVTEVWRQQIADNCPFPYRILVWDAKQRKIQNLPAYGTSYLDFVIINYDALSTPGKAIGKTEFGKIKRSKSRGGRFEVKGKILRWQPDCIILDESHRIKSPSARKTTAMYSLRGAPYRVLATGTVVTKKKRIFDIYSQWKFLNPNRFAGMTLADFKTTYGTWVNKGNYMKWIKNKNEEDLHAKIHKDSYSITREECYDLPLKTVQIIPVRLEESAQTYIDMADDMVSRLRTGEITEASIVLVQLLRLSQITGGVAKTSPTPEFPKGRLVIVGDEKLRAITSRLEDLMEADEKVVIGAHFLADISRLQAAGKSLGVPTYVVKGGVSAQDREYQRQQFHKVDGGAIFIGQPSASSEGIDLSCASIMQWYSLTPSWVHFTQFSDRIALSKKPTFHEFFIAQGTIDEDRYQMLLDDGNLGRMIIQSPERLLRLRNEWVD